MILPAAESLASLTGPGTQQAAEFEPDECHGDADCADENRRGEQGHVICAEGEADRKVVNAERKPGDQELAQPLGSRIGGFGSVPAEGLHEAVQASGDQERGAGPAGGMPERVGKAMAQQQWTAPVILEALIPGRMQSHASTAEVPRGVALARGEDGARDP